MNYKLKEILKEQGRSQEWLRSQLQVDKSTIWRWINDKIIIPTKHQYTIKDLLGLDNIEELYKEE